jgi:hypothetical protein
MIDHRGIIRSSSFTLIDGGSGIAISVAFVEYSNGVQNSLSLFEETEQENWKLTEVGQFQKNFPSGAQQAAEKPVEQRNSRKTSFRG